MVLLTLAGYIQLFIRTCEIHKGSLFLPLFFFFFFFVQNVFFFFLVGGHKGGRPRHIVRWCALRHFRRKCCGERSSWSRERWLQYHCSHVPRSNHSSIEIFVKRDSFLLPNDDKSAVFSFSHYSSKQLKAKAKKLKYSAGFFCLFWFFFATRISLWYVAITDCHNR